VALEDIAFTFTAHEDNSLHAPTFEVMHHDPTKDALDYMDFEHWTVDNFGGADDSDPDSDSDCPGLITDSDSEDEDSDSDYSEFD